MSFPWLVDRRRLAWQATLALLLSVAAVSVGYKLVVARYSLREVLPRHRYDVSYELSLDGHESPARVRTFLPQSDERQAITELGASSAPGVVLGIHNEDLNRVAVWSGSTVPDTTTLQYGFSVLSSRRSYEIDPTLQVPPLYGPGVEPYLRSEEVIQADAPEIVELAHRIGADEGPLLDRLTAIYTYTAGLETRPFKGTTDALTAMRLEAASCNGKSRLFVALARAVGIPSRLVGGLVMNGERKRTSHQWVEAYVAGHWVPFGPTNHHFAEIPENYLVLYRGDHALFSHTKEVNFDYVFDIRTVMVPSPAARTSFGSLNLWALFERLGLPFSLLRTLLMLPAGALIVVFFRNVVGMPTYGTFLPALIAVSVVDGGLLWAVACLIGVLMAVSVVRLAVHRLELLHSPTLALMLAAVVATLVVVVACAIVMQSLALQILLTGFPEILLVVVAADVYLGRWIGVRLSEYRRFQPVLHPEVA